MSEQQSPTNPQPHSPESGDRADEVAGVLACVCGEKHGFDGQDDVAECDCGRTYVLTVSALDALPGSP